MSKYSVAVAKNTLPSLIDKAQAGEEVVITRHGKPVAELRATPKAAVRSGSGTFAWLMKRTQSRPAVTITSVELLDQMYEEDRD
ncbi:MAG TPA: type II toxin-antitoxin system prevent-host-death family antitoxin [Caulobacteraceae bacterium]